MDINSSRFTINRDVIFVHVPKTGGKSVTAALPPHFRNKYNKVPTHLPLCYADYPEGAFTFGFVRNPWDRMVSYYSYMCQRESNIGDDWDVRKLKKMGFKKWLIEFDYKHYMKDQRQEPITSKFGVDLEVTIQKRSQMYWLDGCTFIGRFETLGDDLEEAARLSGITELNELRHINPSKHTHYTEYYDDETIAFVAKYFSQEIERFGYKYGEN